MPGSDTDICEIRITAPDPEWLVAHTRRLVSDGLVACGQHETTVRSIYRWQGSIEDDTEARVALHTQRRHVPEIIRRTTDAHPDDVPGIIVVPVVDGQPDYLQWVRDSTDGQSGL
ncbi:MAG: divalent-cation tolerance protein CutA [Acidimicrobiales bacterium]